MATQADGCDYNERGRRCGQPVVWRTKATWARPAWRLCERHIDPRFWPPDLHKLLPGRVRRSLIKR